jgi:hypothetical protein
MQLFLFDVPMFPFGQGECFNLHAFLSVSIDPVPHPRRTHHIRCLFLVFSCREIENVQFDISKCHDIAGSKQFSFSMVLFLGIEASPSPFHEPNLAMKHGGPLKPSPLVTL